MPNWPKLICFKSMTANYFFQQKIVFRAELTAQINLGILPAHNSLRNAFDPGHMLHRSSPQAWSWTPPPGSAQLWLVDLRRLTHMLGSP